jgi:uncharacterized protein YuzE
MKISYDKEVGILYIKVIDVAKIIETEEVANGVLYDYDENNKVVGIEIMLNQNPEIELQLKNLSNIM